MVVLLPAQQLPPNRYFASGAAMARPISLEVWNPSGKYRVVSTKPMPGTRWIRLLTEQDCRVEAIRPSHPRYHIYLPFSPSVSIRIPNAKFEIWILFFFFFLPRYARRRIPYCPWMIFSLSSVTGATG